MNLEDGKNDADQEIDHIYQKIAGKFEILYPLEETVGNQFYIDMVFSLQ